MDSILTYLRALLALAARPRRERSGVIHTVVVIQTMKMGDMVCTTPLFRALKTHLPHVRIVLLCDRLGAEVIRGNPDVDRTILFNGARNFSGALKTVTTEAPDVGIMVGPDPTGLALLACSHARMIIAPMIRNGVSPYETGWYRLMRYFVVTRPHHMGSYAPREYLRLLEPLGIDTSDTTKHLVYSSTAGERVRVLLDTFQGRTIGIVPSAGNRIKEWPPERFAAVANHCAKTHNARIVLLGGPNDPAGKTCAALIDPSVPVVNLSGFLTIEELKAVIAKLDLLVAADTGPIYIAEAFGVPTVDIVGPVDEREQPPQGERHVVVVPPGPRTPQLQVLNARATDRAEARRQAESITVPMVTAAVDALIAKVKN